MITSVVGIQGETARRGFLSKSHLQASFSVRTTCCSLNLLSAYYIRNVTYNQDEISDRSMIRKQSTWGSRRAYSSSSESASMMEESVRGACGRWARALRRAVRGRAHVLRGARVSLRNRAAPPATAAALTDPACIDRPRRPPLASWQPTRPGPTWSLVPTTFPIPYRVTIRHTDRRARNETDDDRNSKSSLGWRFAQLSNKVFAFGLIPTFRLQITSAVCVALRSISNTRETPTTNVKDECKRHRHYRFPK